MKSGRIIRRGRHLYSALATVAKLVVAEEEPGQDAETLPGMELEGPRTTTGPGRGRAGSCTYQPAGARTLASRRSLVAKQPASK